MSDYFTCRFSGDFGGGRKVCGLAYKNTTYCYGEEKDRICCPYWAQIYHANKVIE